MKEIPLNIYDLAAMCRLCLSRSATMSDLFTFSVKLGNQVANVIMDCAPIQITRQDEMPNLICQTCYTQLEKSHQFRKQIIQADITLRRYLHGLHPSDKQMKTECSNQGPSDDTSICNITKKCESLEMQENSPQNFDSTTENSYEMSIKSEIKDELMDNNLLFPRECTEETETLSKADDSEYISSITNVCNIDLGEDDLATNSKLADQIIENPPLKFEIKDEPMDDNSLIVENVENLSKYAGREFNCVYVTENFDKREEELQIPENPKKSNVNKRYQCFQCKKSFETTQALKRHARIHAGKNLYKCDVCNKCFNQSDNLKIHKRTHTGEKPYKCDVCSKFLSTSYTLKKHKRTHGEKPYMCDDCDKCFYQLGDLNIHKRTHTGEKPYKCDVCNKCFNKAHNLKRHKNTHTGEKPYKCDVCNKCYTEFKGLKFHKSTHTGEKPYKCDVCNKCFYQSRYLKVHKRTHTGEKPYKCDVCNKCFIDSHPLNIHKRTHVGENSISSDVVTI